MRIAALADLHLGFRAFAATVAGRNLREVDVEKAWSAAVAAIIATGVDLVTIAGDIFHHPRVSDHAKKAFLDGIRALLDAGIPVIVLQGNHDAGKTADVLTPIKLAERPGANLWIVTEPKRIRFVFPGDRPAHSGTCAVACFPFVSRGDGAAYRMDPDPTADVNVLVMHASVKGHSEGGALPYFYGSGAEAIDIGRQADRWDVIAVGDYHEFTMLHPEALAFYSGSIERTSSNIWNEHAPKGWVLVDTEAGTAELQEIPTRPMLDIGFDDGFAVPNAENVNFLLASLGRDARAEETEGAIVRLKVPDFPREERDAVDWALVRDLKHRCAHFELDLRFQKAEIQGLGDRREIHRAGIREQAEAFFEGDDQDVRDLAATYLEVSFSESHDDHEAVEEAEEAVPA